MSKYWERTKYPCILQHKDKHADIYYIAQNPEEHLKIYKRHFKYVDEDLGYYQYQMQEETEDVKLLYNLIKSGKATFRDYYDWFYMRNDYEYEKLTIVYPDWSWKK